MGISGGAQRVPPENAGQEEVSSLYARPIVFQATQDPLLLEGGVSLTPASGDDKMQILRRHLETPLRMFTQRLLKRDAWLWVFYMHLLVLYAIAGSCLSTGASTGTGDCVDLTIRQ